MKRILIAALVAMSVTTKAITIKRDTAGYNYVNITPVTAKVGDTVQSTRLTVKDVGSDMTTWMRLYYELRDENGQLYLRGNVMLDGFDYANNDKTPEFLYTFTASKLTLTIVP